MLELCLAKDRYDYIGIKLIENHRNLIFLFLLMKIGLSDSYSDRMATDYIWISSATILSMK